MDALMRDPLQEHDQRLHRQLTTELSQAGCFRPAAAHSAAHGALIVAVYGVAYAALLTAPSPWLRGLAIVAAAFFSVQAGFIAHEAGHKAITRNRHAANLLGQVFHTLLSGLSYSYFQFIHRRHHPHCNDRGRDPDMQSAFVSMYRESALSKSGLGRLISRHQAVLVWILIGLQGLTLKLDGLTYVLRNLRRTRADQVFLTLHLAIWIAPAAVIGVHAAAVNYWLMTALIGFYVGTIFVVNHVGTQVIEPGEPISFFRQEISVTRNLGASRLHDFIFGGVNNHIEHHLFPSMPTAHLRRARCITRAFCRRHGLAYREMSWLEAAREVTRHFRAMSAFIR